MLFCSVAFNVFAVTTPPVLCAFQNFGSSWLKDKRLLCALPVATSAEVVVMASKVGQELVRDLWSHGLAEPEAGHPACGFEETGPPGKKHESRDAV